jgi:hypothetical protein
MATFKTRVQQLSGTTSSDELLSDWLTAGARVLSNLIPDSELHRYISSTNVTEAGTTITDGIIYTVTKDGYTARKVDVNNLYGLTRRDSLYYPSSKTPVYSLIGKTLKVFPEGGQVWMLPLYVVLHSDSAIANFPTQLEHAVVLFASIANKTAQMQAFMPTITLAYNNAASASINATTIDTLPSPLTYGPVSAPTLVVFTGTAPTAPTFTDVTVPAGVTIPPELTATTNILFQTATAVGIAAETIGSFPTAPTFTKVAEPPVYTSFDARAAADDVELAQTYIQKVARQQEDWATKVNEELQEFNAQYQVFREDVNKLLEQAKINLQQKIADAQDKNQIEQFNKLKAFEATVQEYTSQLARYQANVERYVQIVNSEISRQTANIQAKTQVYSASVSAFATEANVVAERNQILIAEYNAKMQDAVNKYQADLSAYQATIQRSLQQAELTQQRLIQQAAQDTDVSKTNESAKLQAAIQEYQIKLGRLSALQAELQSLLAQYNDTLQKYMINRYAPAPQG